jgi:hypothetical protein
MEENCVQFLFTRIIAKMKDKRRNSVQSEIIGHK